MTEETVEETLDLMSLRRDMERICMMVLADIPVPSARSSVIAQLTEFTFAGSHTLLSTARVVDLCNRMETDPRLNHSVLEITERFMLQLKLKGWWGAFMKNVGDVVDMRAMYTDPDCLLDKRVTAALRPPPNGNLKDILEKNTWLVTLYAIVITGVAHSLSAVDDKPDNT